jgi:hypothetical protein
MATRKIKRYAGGGGLYGIPEQTEQEASNERSLDADLQRREMLDRAYAEGAQDDGPGRSSYATTPSPAREEPTYSSRGEAFKAARANGDKTFMYNGKSYTTEITGETKKSKPAAKPAAKTYTSNYSNEGSKYKAPASTSTPTDVTQMSVNDRLKAAKNKSREGTTDSRSVNERFRSAFGFKSGGVVSSASKRGDGIAQRGKTRGKVC